MRTFPRRCLVSALALLAFSIPALAQTQASEEKDIRSIGAQVQDAWNKRDAKMLADLWLTDGDYVSSTGRTATGAPRSRMRSRRSGPASTRERSSPTR